MKPYNNQTTMEKLDDLAYEWLKKKWLWMQLIIPFLF